MLCFYLVASITYSLTLHWATVVFSATVHLCVKVSNTHQGEPINWKPQTFFSLKCFAKLPHYTYIYEPLHNLKVWSFVLIIYFRKKKRSFWSSISNRIYLLGLYEWELIQNSLSFSITKLSLRIFQTIFMSLLNDCWLQFKGQLWITRHLKSRSCRVFL